MAAKRAQTKPHHAPQQGPTLARKVTPVILAWLVPGAGHYYLKRPIHGVVLLATIVAMFLTGLLLQGRMFQPSGGDLFTILMTYGGYVADLCNGLLYFATVGLGYSQETVPGALHDYGTKFIACAGLLNILAMVDAYEIAAGKKVAA